jgi:dihydrodipicolinate synthase/N-acetylneuraminate lyase
VDIRGIVVPLITPLRPDQTLDEDALARLVEHVIAGGVAGIFVLGSSGEGPTLPLQIREQVVRQVKVLARGRVAVLAGLFNLSTRSAAEEAQRLAAWGADAITVTAPCYFQHTQEEIYGHIASLALSAPVPTMIYNIPQMTKTIIEPETVARLGDLPNVIGLKDSAGDMVRFQQHLALQRDGFAVYQGAEGLAALSVVRGARGAVLGLANVAPALCSDLYRAASQGDLVVAWALQERLQRLWRLHTHGQWLPCLKAAVSQLGLCNPMPCAPFAQVDAAAIAQIRRDMHAAGILLQP